ncbi:glutathione synthase [uncultured Gammaproteobacteria bacterium]
MSLVIAIQMDPIESINIDADSTFVMALEAQRRGHTLYHYLPRHLSLRQNRLTARARPLRVVREHGAHWQFGPWEVLDLSAVDVIMMRQDPPFDLSYITATHLLEHVQPKVLVTNDPANVRNAPEKLFVTRFPDLMPPPIHPDLAGHCPRHTTTRQIEVPPRPLDAKPRPRRPHRRLR